MSDYGEILTDLDDWVPVQPEAAKAIRKLLARVAELESEKWKLDVRIHDLQAERDYWENKCLALEER